MVTEASSFGRFCAAGLKGELRLRFSENSSGKTYLNDRYRSKLFHTSRTYLEGKRQVLQVLNPTAGLFENDSLEAKIQVDEKAHVAILSPSSTQIFTMPGEGRACSKLCLEVADEASLVYLPRWVVPHRGSRFFQGTRMNLSSSASVCYFDFFSAGRFAHKEYLEFEHFESRLDIFLDGKRVVRELFDCGKSRRPWLLQSGEQKFAYYMSAYLYSTKLDRHELQSIMQYSSDDHNRISWTELEDGLFCIRALADSSLYISEFVSNLSAVLPVEIRLPDTHYRTL